MNFFTKIELKKLLPEKKLNVFLKLVETNNEAYKVFCSKYSGDEVDWKLTFNVISRENKNFTVLELIEYKNEKIYNKYKPVTLYSYYYYEPNNTLTQLLNATTIAATMLLNKTDIRTLNKKLKTISELYKAFKEQ